MSYKSRFQDQLFADELNMFPQTSGKLGYPIRLGYNHLNDPTATVVFTRMEAKYFKKGVLNRAR